VKKSPIAGYGVFAVCDLEPFTPLLVERELFEGTMYDIYDKYEALTEEQKKAYNRLHGHKRAPTTDTRAAIWHTNQYVQNPLIHRAVAPSSAVISPYSLP
jgi:hypothetical protein